MEKKSEKFGPSSDPELLVARYIEAPRGDLRDLIMVQYTGTVERVARKFSGIEPVEDLVQVGYIGLLNALSKFDPTSGVKFSTYATYLVAGEIKHYLRDRSQTIRQPAWLQELRQKVSRAQSLLQGELSRPPTHREIADHLGISESSVTDVLATAELLKVGSLDATASADEDGDSEIERLDAADFCPEQLEMEDRLVLEGAIKQLRELEQQVLILFHFESMSQTEVANQLDISVNYVSHILRQSLAKLRRILSTEAQKDRLLRRQSSAFDFDLTDEEVGAYTEGFLRNRLDEEIHRASSAGNEVAVITIRFDGLDELRRYYGAQSVSDFLVDAAEVLKANVRRLDIVGRLGEAGFAVILPMTGNSVALVRERLLKQAQRWAAGRLGPTSLVKVEVGKSQFPADGRTSRALLDAASGTQATAMVA